MSDSRRGRLVRNKETSNHTEILDSEEEEPSLQDYRYQPSKHPKPQQSNLKAAPGPKPETPDVKSASKPST